MNYLLKTFPPEEPDQKQSCSEEADDVDGLLLNNVGGLKVGNGTPKVPFTVPLKSMRRSPSQFGMQGELLPRSNMQLDEIFSQSVSLSLK